MAERDSLFDQPQGIGDFVFDERVARAFDDMISRSVPYYNEIQRMQTELVMDLLPERAEWVCDLGCSTGTTLHRLVNHQRCPLSLRFLGIDSSSPMLEQARSKLEDPIGAGRVSLVQANLDPCPELPACNVVLMNWTLQFVRPIHRETLIGGIYSALRPGGALFLSEKVLGPEGRLNRLYINHYLRYKAVRSGYTDQEIQNKREALENVLVPYRVDENYALLERCGFGPIDIYFRWFNFACFLAIKR